MGNSVAIFLNTLILLGALQGFIVFFLLVRSPKNGQANYLLGILLLLIAVASLNLYLLASDFFLTSKAWRIIGTTVPFIVIMPVGPLLYFYIRASLDSDFRLTRGHYLHFLPTILDIIPNLIALFYTIKTGTDLVSTPSYWRNVVDEYNVYVDIPRWLSITTYLILSVGHLTKINTQNTTPVYKWLRQFTYVFLGFQVIWLAHLIPYILPAYRNILLKSVGWYPVYIPLTALIYWLGVKGYFTARDHAVKKQSLISIPPETISSTVSLLQHSMEKDRLFLDPSFNIGALAKHVELPQKTVSAVLNQHLNKSFNEYINEYRVEEFKKRVGAPHYEHLTITGLALECGFNSQATFQRTFKQVTGISPSEYRLQKSAMKISV